MTQPPTETPGTNPAPVPRAASPGRRPGGVLLPVVLLVAGGYLMWFGVHYWRTGVKWPTDPIKAVLTGQPLPAATRDDSGVADLTGAFGGAVGAAAGGAAGAAAAIIAGDNSAIAADALKYEGQGYVFGGNANRLGNWDCSSFLSYVLGHDFGLTLPGGGRWGDKGYPPNEHGPVASAFKLYGTGIEQGQLAAGDLVVWNTHCAIALDGNRTIAARTTAEGTGVSTISGTSASINESPVFRRVFLGGSGAAGGGGGRAEIR